MRPKTISDLLTPTSLRIAAETVWGEARGEPWLGKLGVAWVIRNRVDTPGRTWWGDTVETVCRKPWQFSCRNEGDPNAAKLARVSNDDPVFEECMRAVEAAFLGSEPDPTDGATHYCVKGLKPAWRNGHEPSAIIANHEFFRLRPSA